MFGKVTPKPPNTLLGVASLPEHEQEVVSLVREVAGDVLDEGKATLEVEPSDGRRPTLCELRPVSADASPLTLQLDSPEQVTLYLGRFGTTCELYRTKRPQLLDDVELFVRGVVDGRYSESVRLSRGKLGRARGELQTANGPIRFSYSALWTLGRRAAWQRLTYSAY